MCVIVLVNNEAQRPSNTMVDMMWDKNGDGGGAAWRGPDPDNPGSNLVHWEKGVMKEPGRERMKELAKTLPPPFVLHFRIATSGGVKPSMCHPFPIDQRGINTLTGSTAGHVLFHNGSAKDWEKEARALAISTGITIPAGKWSDTRGLAWICSILGPGYMEFLPDQKGIAYGPTDASTSVFVGTSNWDQCEDPETKEKIWCSNSHFMAAASKNGNYYTSYRVEPYCSGAKNCFRKDLDSDQRCPEHKIKALGPGSPEVGPTTVPFPPTPKDTDQPQGPLLSMETAEKAMRQGRIGSAFLSSVKRAHENMRRGGKNGDKCRRQLIKAAALPCFLGLQG
jgi:hypothetical protein